MRLRIISQFLTHWGRADKDDAVVTMTILDYRSNCSTLLQNTESYQPLNEDLISSLIQNFNQITKYKLSSNLKKSIKVKHPTLSYFYGVPDVHKPVCPIRPILSSTSSVLCCLSKFLIHTLSTHRTLLQNSVQPILQQQNGKLRRQKSSLKYLYKIFSQYLQELLVESSDWFQSLQLLYRTTWGFYKDIATKFNLI